MPREEQSAPIAPLGIQEQVPLQIPLGEQVEPLPQPEIEVHEVHSDLEEEARPTTCPLNILTSMTSSIPGIQLSESIFDSLFLSLIFLS